MSKHGLTESIPSVYVTDPAGANRMLPLVHIVRVDSTNTACMNQLREQAGESWFAIWTDDQTAGRGRQGRAWESQRGASLCLSVGRRLAPGLHAPPALTVALGAAVVSVLQKHGCAAQLKWPNDIVLKTGGGFAKLGGILCEASSSGAGASTVLVAGVGINLQPFAPASHAAAEPHSEPAHLSEPASFPALPKASLQEAGISLTAETLALELAQATTEVLSAACDAQALSTWCETAKQLDAWRGMHLRVHERGQVVLEGVAQGVSPDGQYLLQTQDGTKSLSVGELSLRLPFSASQGAVVLVDIGNTRLKWCMADANGQFLSAVEHVSSHIHTDETQLESFFACMATALKELAQPVSIRLARVGPHPWLEHFRLFADRQQLALHVVESTVKQGPLINTYAQPNQLGVDRFLGALAVVHSFSGQAAVIVSAGTATTIDAVDAQGRFLGGYILPGPQMMASSLHRNTAQLPQVQPQWALFPGSTEQAIASGIAQAQAGAVRGMLSALQQAVGAEPIVVMTGGARQWLRPLFENAAEREYLVLEGLARWQAD